MSERLAWVIAVLIMVWLMNLGFRLYQARRLRQAHLSVRGKTSLIVVVASRCPVCPAQKSVAAKLRERYPADLLSVDAIDAERQPAQARSLGVMTVPATVVLGADGSAAHINHGFTPFDVLARQIDGLLPPHARAPKAGVK